MKCASLVLSYALSLLILCYCFAVLRVVSVAVSIAVLAIAFANIIPAGVQLQWQRRLILQLLLIYFSKDHINYKECYLSMLSVTCEIKRV